MVRGVGGALALEKVGGRGEVGGGGGVRGPEKSVERVGHAFYLLDFAAIDEAKGKDAAVSGRDEGGWVGVEGPYTGAESTEEEGGEVGVGV